MEAIIEKIENVRIPFINLLYKNICSVCFEKGEQEKISGDKGHTLIKCTKCDIRVHLRCYGEKNPHFRKSSAKTSEEDYFECEKCLNKDTNCGCIICNVKDGYMVRLDPKKYVHVICALFTDYFEIVDFLKMKIELKIPLKDIEKINAFVNNKNRCDICLSSQGVLLECECETIEQKSQCGHKVHFYCALRDRYMKLSNDSDAIDYWQIEWKFNYKGSFSDDSMDVYNTTVLSRRNDMENTIIDRGNTNNISHGIITAEDVIVPDTAVANDNKKKSKVASKPKKPSKSTSGKKSNISEDTTGSLTTSANNGKNTENNSMKNSLNEEIQIINSLNSKFSKTTEKNWVLKNRGGEIKILCEDHREDVTYCVCRKSSGSEFMICCDNCEAWFHGRCLGFSNKEINSLKKWYCSFCTEWINNRNNYLLKESNEDVNEDLINQAKSKSWKMPVIHNHLQYKVIDLLFISILYWRKAEVLLKHPCTSEILSKHISLCYEIPFNLSRQILNLKRKDEKYSQVNLEIENFFLGGFKNISLEELDLVKVKNLKNTDDVNMIITEDQNMMNNKNKTEEVNEVFTYGDLQIELNLENYKRIEAYHEDLAKLYSQTHDTTERIINENFAFLEKLLKKLKWAKTAYEVIAQSGSQSSLQDVKSVCLSYTDVFCGVNSLSTAANAPSNIPAIKEPENSLNPSPPFHKEYSLLTRYMTDYSTWQKNTKEMLSSHMKQKGEAEKILHDIESKIKKDEVALTQQEAKEIYVNYLSSKLGLIEKQKEKMKINLATKIPIEKIKEIIKNGRNLKINASKEIESIDSCLGEALEWDSAFEKFKNQSSLKIEEIQKLIQNCTNILVCTPLMYDAVEYFSEFEIFHTNVQNFLYNEKSSQLNYLPQLISNYENKFYIFKDDLFVKKIESLFKIREKILKIQDHVKDNLMNNNDIKILKKLKESIEKEHKVFLKEEIEKLEQKIFYLNNIENLLNQKNDMKSLELIERLIDEYNINAAKDCNIKEKINSKKDKILQIKSKILFILGNINTEGIELKYTHLKNIKEEIASNSIQLEEEKIVEDSIKVIEWYTSASFKFKDLLEMDSEDIKTMLVNTEENLLDDLIETISFLEKIEKNSEIILNLPEIKSFYGILQFFVWIIKADRMINILNEENPPLEKNKIEINELNSLLSMDFLNTSSLPATYLEFYKSRLIILQNLNCQLNLWMENYKSLELSIYAEGVGVKNFELSSKLLISLQNDKIISEKINLNSKANLADIKTILKVTEKLIAVLESKNLSMEERPDKDKILHTIKECEAKLSEQKIKYPLLKQFYHYGEISKELEKFESWIENYSQYINHKRNNQADKIDFSLLEVLQEESKKIIVNLSSELGILTRDLELNKNWISTAKMLLEQSENLNNIDKILLSKENEENLEKIYTQLTNNQVAIQDKNLTDLVKSLQWATRARSLLRAIEINPASKLNYRIAFRTSQEANSLKYFYEIKKKDYYTCLMSQVTLAKNIRDISEILKNSSNALSLNASHMPNLSNPVSHHHQAKQVTEEQFDKIVKDFLNKCHVDLPEEREIVESFIKLKSQYEKKFETFLTSKINLSEYEKLLTELKKFPIHLERLIREIDLILYENKIILKDVRKIFEQFNKTGTHSTMLLTEKIQPIYERYKNSKASFAEGDQLARMYETSEEKLKTLKSALILPGMDSTSEIISHDTTLDIYDLINLMDSIEVHNTTEERILRKKLWKRKFDSFIENPCELFSSNFSHIRNLVIEANELNILNHAEENYKEEYNKLLDICEKSQEIIREIFSTRSSEELTQVKDKINTENSCIDFGEYLIEQETRLGLNKILPQAQVNKNLENLFLGIKRKSDEQIKTVESARSKKSAGSSERHVKELISINISQSALDEENYPKENENEISNLKENNEQISLANSNLNINNTGLANTRSKRRVNLKLDKDYLYDKEFLENFENKIAKRLKKSNMQNDIEINVQDDKMEVVGNLQDEDYINDDVHDLEKTKFKNKNLLSPSHISSEQIQAPTVTTSFKTNLIKNLIKKNPTNDVNMPSVSTSQVDRDNTTTNLSPNSLRELSIQSLTKILTENPTFNKEGDEYITKLAHELEEELFKSYSKLDRSYTNGFENMSKTVKELEKYKRVSILVTKGKLSLPKVAKFPYGEKYFEKLKKIDESVQSQISQKNKKKITETNTSLNIPISSDTLSIGKSKPETNFISMISDIDKLYSSLNRSSKTESKVAIKSVTEFVTEIDDENNLNDDDNNSLKSLSDKDRVRFSPDGGHYVKSGNNVITSATAKSSNIQSPSSPILYKKEISTISTFENIYNPFETEEEEKDRDRDNYFEFDLNVINVKSVKSSNSSKKNLIQPIFYDPFKNSDSVNRSASTRSSKINSPNISLGLKKKSANNFDSIFQIWKGNLNINKLTLNNISMLSTNAPEIFTSIQNLPEEINIASKAKTKEVIPYIERYLGNKSDKISYGWFEIENEDEIESYQALADDYDKNDRSGFHSFNDIKYYIFTLSKRYSKFYKKMKNEFRIFNKSLMNHIDKLIVFVMIRKNESNENICEENNINRENCIKPMILLTLINKGQTETIGKQEEKNSNLTANIAEDNQMSPITSDEEDNNNKAEEFTNFGNDKIYHVNNAQSTQYVSHTNNDYLEELLSGDDLEKLEEYVNSQFANLSQEEIIHKLISLDESHRAKLLNLIMEYQQRISNSQGGGNVERKESEEIHVDENDITEEDIENKDPMNAMDIDDMNERYQEVSGFNNSNASTDLLKKEILKNQDQANRNAEAMINEDLLKRNMNANTDANMSGVPHNQLVMNQMQYMNMNYPMVNMNQAYMVNQSYPQNMNYHQMNAARPNMQMMMQRGGQNYNGMMPQNMSNMTPQAQAAYNMNLYNQRNMNNQNSNNNLNNK